MNEFIEFFQLKFLFVIFNTYIMNVIIKFTFIDNFCLMNIKYKSIVIVYLKNRFKNNSEDLELISTNLIPKYNIDIPKVKKSKGKEY